MELSNAMSSRTLTEAHVLLYNSTVQLFAHTSVMARTWTTKKVHKALGMGYAITRYTALQRILDTGVLRMFM